MYRVSQKKRMILFLAITPLWKGLEIKVGWFFKNSGNVIGTKIFQIVILEVEKIWSKDSNQSANI